MMSGQAFAVLVYARPCGLASPGEAASELAGRQASGPNLKARALVPETLKLS